MMIFPLEEAAAYDGRPTSDPNVRWLPSMVKDHVLYAAPAWGGWACGSLTWWDEQYIFQFGRYDVTLRAWPHDVLSFHALLWPQSEQWPPEIDIAESFHAQRNITHAFLHGCRKQEFSVEKDITQPTTFSVIWEPDRIQFLCDGDVFGDTRDDSPQQPHRFVIQVETHGSHEGYADDKTRGQTQHLGPPQQHLMVPVVELLEVCYTPYQA